MWQAVIAFLSGLWSGIKARNAAKAASELPQGEAQGKASASNVSAIEAELKRTAPASVAPGLRTEARSRFGWPWHERLHDLAA